MTQDAHEEVDTDVDTIQPPQDDIRGDIMRAIEEEKSKADGVEPEPAPKRGRPRKDAQTEQVAVDPTVATAPEKPVIQPPTGAPNAVKQKWNELPEDVRTEIARREDEIHKKITQQDETYKLGKDLKEVISPYMPVIVAQGGSPTTAVANLLNTAYQLNTGSPEQKLQLFQQLAQQYGIDTSALNQQQDYQDPYILQLQSKISELEQRTNPQFLQKQWQDQMETATIKSEVQAFASDPTNAYYGKVAPIMAALVSSGRARNLKEAYDAACWADPEVRSTLEADRIKQLDEKRKQELDAKKKAAVSVSGSYGQKSNSTAPSSKSLRDTLSEAFASHNSTI